jgi:hypothetical protein
VLDRCYIHGWAGTDLKRGVALNSSYTTISNCYISDWHHRSQDSQAIGGWNGPGNYTITNNYLEAAGENILFGGADASIPNLVPSNIVIRGNLVAKPLSWNPKDPSYAGVDYSVKNLFELKNASNVTVDRNIFENNWVDSQVGFGILLKVANQDGGNPWATCNNVQFTNNIVRHTANAVNILTSDANSLTLHDVTLRNNLFYDIGGTQWGGGGIGFQFVKGAQPSTNITLEHNTLLGKNSFITADAYPSGPTPLVTSGFVFRNNLVEHGTYGLKGSGTADGNATLAAYFPNAVCTGNVIIGGSSSAYPAGNFYPANDAAVGFLDAANGKYTLASNSAYRGKATDATDPGVNYPTVTSMIRINATTTNAATVNFRVTFSVPVSGVDPSDFAIVPTGINGASIASVSGSGTTWNIFVNTGTGDGTLGLNVVDDDTILDAGGAPLGGLLPGNGNFTGPLFTIDKTAPLLGITSPTAGAMLWGTTPTITGIAGIATGDGSTVDIRIYSGNTTSSQNQVQKMTSSVTAGTGAYSWTTATLPEGIYTAKVTQTDSAGNISTATVTFMVYATLPGDANHDGTVNFADFTILSNNYGGPGGTTSVGDFNFDGVVNFADYTILSNNYGKTATPSGTAAIAAKAITRKHRRA